MRAGLLCVCLSVAAASGCGSETDSVKDAVTQLAEAAREEDTAEVCRLLFANVFLPAAVAEQAGVPAGSPGRTADFEADQKECARDLRGDVESFAEAPRLTDVKVREVTEAQGITAVASARGTFKDGKPQRLHFVKYDGRWRVLFISN